MPPSQPSPEPLKLSGPATLQRGKESVQNGVQTQGAFLRGCSVLPGAQGTGPSSAGGRRDGLELSLL